MPRRMYLTSRRTAAVAASLGVLAAAWLTMKSHHRAARWLAHVAAGDTAIAFDSSVPERQLDNRKFMPRARVSLVPPMGAMAAAPAQPLALEDAVAGRPDNESVPLSDIALGSTADASRMIVRSGGASIEVTSIDSAIPRVRALAAAIGGFVANSSVQAGRDQARSAMLEVKAPADAFERLITSLSPLGKVENVNVSAQDVGEEYVDVEARMANDHRLEERLIELLATRTGKLKDVLDVERELAHVREEIERYEGRLRFLRSHAELSTLTISVHEPVPIIDHVSPNPIAAAARQAWRNFIALVAFAIASLGVLIPLAAVGGGLWFFLRPAKPVESRPA